MGVSRKEVQNRRCGHTGTKKFIVGRFLDYKLVDLNPVVKQLEDLPVIINQIHVERMTISEPFQVACISEKLLPLLVTSRFLESIIIWLNEC